MFTPGRALLDPCPQRTNLLFRQARFMGASGRHEANWVRLRNSLKQQTLVRLARDNNLGGRALARIKAQSRHTAGGITAVATETLVGQKRQHIPAKAHRFLRSQWQDKQPQKSTDRHTVIVSYLATRLQ